MYASQQTDKNGLNHWEVRIYYTYIHLHLKDVVFVMQPENEEYLFVCFFFLLANDFFVPWVGGDARCNYPFPCALQSSPIAH